MSDLQKQQRMEFLETSNRWCLFALDIAASMVHIHGRISHSRNPTLILGEAQKHIRRLLVDFEATAFYAVNENDASFVQADCQPSEKAAVVDGLVDKLIDNGDFAWALNQNKTVVSRTRTSEGSRIILHVLATQSRVRGMFVAVLDTLEETMARPMENLLTIILHNTAYALESAELYRLLDDLNTSLEERIRESLIRILDQKRELEIKLVELRQTKESLAAAKEAAEAANRSKSAFLATISHEIRTPMNAIIGMNKLMLEADLPPQEREYAAIATKAGEALMTLISDVLDISRIEADQLIIHPEPFDLAGLIGETMAILTVTAREKGLTLQVVLDPQLKLPVVGDAARLRQVIFNLAANAIKFTRQGSITLAIARRTEERVRFSLSDTGIGIPHEYLERIFHPFTQVDNTPSRQHGGSGLGLAICRRLVELMGGTIWVESQPDQGSTFWFELPLPVCTATKPGPAVDHAVPVHHLGRRLSILLVEDSEDNRALIQAYLRVTPHHLDLAENGQQGLEMAQSGGYDLILMDIQMPVMDGFEATRRLRAWEQTLGRPPIPVIALSAYAMKEDTEAILDAGCDRHLTKPIDKATLLAALQQY